MSSGLTSASCATDTLRVGFWDETGHLASLRVSVNGADIASYTAIANGAVELPLANVLLTDTVRIEGRDDADNRQVHEKSVGELYTECIVDPSRVNPNPKVTLLREKSIAQRVTAVPQRRRAMR